MDGDTNGGPQTKFDGTCPVNGKNLHNGENGGKLGESMDGDTKMVDRKRSLTERILSTARTSLTLKMAENWTKTWTETQKRWTANEI